MADTKVEIDLDYKGLEQCLEEIGRDFQGEGYGLDRLLERYRSFRKPGMGPAEGMEALIRSAAELTSKETPLWEFAAARLRYCGFACEVEEQLKGLGIKGLYEKISYLTEQGLYGDYILKHYSREEIEEAEGFLDDERNKLFTYADWICCLSGM